MIHITVSEGTNRNLPDRNTLVQRLSLYTDPESHNAQRYRQTDIRHDDANSRLYSVAEVRWAKNHRKPISFCWCFRIQYI